MTLLEIIEKQKEEQKIKELALSQKITKEEASWRYYKGTGKHRYLYSRNLDTAEVENIMIDDKELFMKSVELNPKVINQKTIVSEETGQEITYIKVKK